MPPGRFVCKRCGHCCTELNNAFQGTMTHEEYEEMLAVAPNNISISEWVSFIEFVSLVDYWINPKTGDEVDRCPWLRFHKAERYKNKGAISHCKH